MFNSYPCTLNQIWLSRTSRKLFPSPLLLYLGNRPLFVIGASLPNDHYSFLTVDILLPWSISQRRRLYTAPTEPISCIISEPKTCRMASISVIGVSVQLMILKDKKVLTLNSSSTFLFAYLWFT